MAPLLAEVARGEGAKVPWAPFVAPTLGVQNLTVFGLLERLARELALPRADPSAGPVGRVLDTGVEAQVHGPIEIERDIERLVVDPAFARTATGDCLKELCRKYAIPLDWHGGFCLAVRDVPDDFRGPAVARLARRIASDGVLDAAVIGTAEASLRSRPGDWRDLGSHEEVLQYLKQLWHVLVHYGPPAPTSSGSAPWVGHFHAEHQGQQATLWLEGPIFEPLEDAGYFQRFFLDGGTVSSSETLYEQAKSSEAARHAASADRLRRPSLARMKRPPQSDR